MITFPRLEKCGRLGNQLWQIAGTIGLAHAQKEPVGIPASWSYRPFFNIPDEFFLDDPKGMDAGNMPTWIDPRSRLYLQDYSLWSPVSYKIREYFAPSREAIIRVREIAEATGFCYLNPPVLSVHVRRGDNVPGADPGCLDKHLYHPLRPLSYYLEAMESVKNHYDSVAVFSDDPDWCRQHIPADYYHEGATRSPWGEPDFETDPVLDWIDLFMMSQCSLHIISNSSYAWWGAYLSDNPSPIYPSPWYGPNLAYVNADAMFPMAWERREHKVVTGDDLI